MHAALMSCFADQQPCPPPQTTHGMVTTHVAGVDLILQCQTADRHHVNASASLERRETLAEQCALFGVMCLNIGPGMFTPNEEGVAGSEKQSDGSLLLLLDTEGGKGNAQCNDSTVLWNMRMNPGEKEFDGRDQNGVRNRRITVSIRFASQRKTTKLADRRGLVTLSTLTPHSGMVQR